MPECNHCGSHVRKAYVRVFEPEPGRGVDCCPHCPDRKRKDGKPAEALASKKGGTGASWYQKTSNNNHRRKRR